MIEFPMDILWYDTILRSIKLGEYEYDYGSDTAKAFADEFEERGMTLHVDLFRYGIAYIPDENFHPYLLLAADNSPEEFLSLIHLCHIANSRLSPIQGLERYKVDIDPKSTLDNVILHWYT